MTMINVNDELYNEISKVIKDYPIDYPTIKNFIDKTCREKIEQLMINEKEANKYNEKEANK